MRISWLVPSVVLSVALGLGYGAAATAVEHPDVQLLDAQGESVMRLEQASESRSCGQCHDSRHIAQSLKLAHQQDSLALTLTDVLRVRLGNKRFVDVGDSPCSSCHGSLSAAEQPGFVSGKALNSGSDPQACSACHGELVLSTQPPFLPGVDYRPADLAAFTGALLSGQRVNSSAMNVHDKTSRSDPFDIHLARGLVCTDCHQGGNRPGSALRPGGASPDHLRRDPRDVPLREYLQRPDHSMQTALQCTDCHRADSGHEWLPFAAQHMRRLACESCHIPTLLGPALQSIDLVSGERDVRGRDSRGLVFGYTPLLLDMQSRLTPFNLIGISDSPAANRTHAVLAVPLRHGVVRDGARRNCVDCHSPDGLPLASLSLGTRFSDTGATLLGPAAAHSLSLDLRDGELVARATPAGGGFYLLGADQLSWADRLGMLIASATLAGVLLHGFARYLAFRRRGATHEPHQRVYMYGVYERFWHWLQATAIIGLLITGAAIHKPYVFSFLSFAYMVELHNLLGFILLVNAALAAFYHLASGEVKQYLPGTTDLFGRMFLQARYYLQGIFRGDPHPFAKDPGHKLNPLQQITYFGLLNTLLPAQILSGIVIWGAQRWPELAGALGGLMFLAPLHSFMAWLFAAFLIMHIYLTTTSGPRPLSGIQAMLEGWEELESPPGGTE
jgi:thiosulfate reductase cytochrome b subunit